MKKINISNLITISCNLGGIASFVAIAIISSGFVWWAINPLHSNTLKNVPIEKSDNNLAQGIINRAPFGTIVKKVEVVVAPTILDQVKVVGVYAAGVDNSIAFLQIEGKNSISKIGDKVLEGTLKNILPNGVVINDGKQDVTIEISSGNSTSNPAQSSSGNNHGHSYSDNNTQQQTQSNNTTSNSIQQSNDSSQGNSDNSSSQSSVTSNSSPKSTDDMIAQRRKMIEQFQQQNSGN